MANVDRINTDSIFRFVCDTISRTCDLAYVEGAQGTARLLGCMHTFVRYIIQPNEWTPLSDELAAVKDYITFCHLHNSNQSVKLPDDDSYFVRHMSLVGPVMDLCPIDEPDMNIDICVEIIRNDTTSKQLVFTIKKESRSKSEEYKQQWDL